ncbi:MAG: hypothetical protein AAGK23_14585, partial [Pseudomonadota bacterium]
YEETIALWGKQWDELRLQDFNESRYCFNFLEGSSFKYFFLAMIYCLVEEGEAECFALDMLLTFWTPYIQDQYNDDFRASKHSLLEKIRSALSRKDIDIFEDFVRFVEGNAQIDQTIAARTLIKALRAK